MCPPSRLCHLKVRDKRYRRFKPAVVAPTPKTASAAPAAIRSHGWPPAAASPVPVLGGFTPPACVPPVDVFVGAGGAGGVVAGPSVGPPACPPALPGCHTAAKLRRIRYGEPHDPV